MSFAIWCPSDKKKEESSSHESTRDGVHVKINNTFTTNLNTFNSITNNYTHNFNNITIVNYYGNQNGGKTGENNPNDPNDPNLLMFVNETKSQNQEHVQDTVHKKPTSTLPQGSKQRDKSANGGVRNATKTPNNKQFTSSSSRSSNATIEHSKTLHKLGRGYKKVMQPW